MLDIQGTWTVAYVNDEVGDAEPDEVATLLFADGQVGGQDPWGGVYAGSYHVEGENFAAEVTVHRSNPDDENVFGIDYPFSVSIEGKFTSPDYISANGLVNGEFPISVNCRRVMDL